jgi:hypothetical protein
MNLDISTGPPDPQQMRDLALAVIRRAIEDIHSSDPELREDARFFFEESLWSAETPWARILDLDKERFLKGLKRKARADYLALPPPGATPPLHEANEARRKNTDAPASTPVPP